MTDSIQSTGSLGRYQLIRPIGRGGMGVVYLAVDTELNREVAIKSFESLAEHDELAERLKQEAILLARLNHRNIIQVYDVVEDDSSLGLVLEFADGPTLAGKLRGTTT